MRVQVMVEMRREQSAAGDDRADDTAAEPERRRRRARDTDAQFLETASTQLRATTFEIDDGFRPVSSRAARGAGSGDEASLRRADPNAVDRRVESGSETDADTVIIRGVIDDGDIESLEAQPDVIRVWRDTPIAFFADRRRRRRAERRRSGVQMVDQNLFGPCGIPPCDCNSSESNGTMQEVAEYLGVDQIWADGFTGEGIVVGIVDGGITAEGRPVSSSEDVDLVPNVIGGWPEDDWGTTGWASGWHGNMTATDVLGMAPDASIYDIRFGTDYLSDALAGFEWAIARHRDDGTPHILSNSWGIFQEDWDPDYATDPDHPFTRKVVEALDEGILVLFAAGNCGARCPDGRCGDDTGPGRSIWGANGHPRVMTVGAANIDEQLIGYSSQGPAALDDTKPDFCSISHFEGYFDPDSGTSAATPIAAGVVALFKQALPVLDQDLAKQALRNTATPKGAPKWNPHAGAGIIQAKEAFDYLPVPEAGDAEDLAWIQPILHVVLT